MKSGANPETLPDSETTVEVSEANSAGDRVFTFSAFPGLSGSGDLLQIRESPDHPHVQSNSALFDGLYALAIHEAVENSVSTIRNSAYRNGEPISLEAFQTGQRWTYVWTRDLAFSVHLALGRFDPPRSLTSLRFKTSTLKAGCAADYAHQIIQDTGSGGSYPVSTDRVVWALALHELLRFLDPLEKRRVCEEAYPFLHDTIELDRRLVFDSRDGLYRGESSFLDWRQQTYPAETATNVLPIALSKALSTNVLHFQALRTAAEVASELGRAEEASRYAEWSAALKIAINEQLYDPQSGQYAAYLYTDLRTAIPTERRDLLGSALAILLGVADLAQARRIIAGYPTGRHGPPVVWPQEPGIPIYHNHAIWPFVTAYWIRAARLAGNTAAVENGIESLIRGTSRHLSNMENLDWVTGAAHAKVNGIEGPTINSRRQLWSVAGYLSMVESVFFGFEATSDGVRFAPYITPRLHAEWLSSSATLELRRFSFQGRILNARIHFPPHPSGDCALEIAQTFVNGQPIPNGSAIPPEQLGEETQWEIHLRTPTVAAASAIKVITNFSQAEDYFSPSPPVWKPTGQDGISSDGKLLTLHFQSRQPDEVTYRVFRDGKLAVENLPSGPWTDPDSSDYQTRIFHYTVIAVHQPTGHSSHSAPTRFYLPENLPELGFPEAWVNQNGLSPTSEQLRQWGSSQDELLLPHFSVPISGRYLFRLRYTNASGTSGGITCAVKVAEITGSDGESVARDYVLMPHTDASSLPQFSSPVEVELLAHRAYSIRIREDRVSLNMSYLKHYSTYTASAGGGDLPHNFVQLVDAVLQPLILRPNAH